MESHWHRALFLAALTVVFHWRSAAQWKHVLETELSFELKTGNRKKGKRNRKRVEASRLNWHYEGHSSSWRCMWNAGIGASGGEALGEQRHQHQVWDPRESYRVQGGRIEAGNATLVREWVWLRRDIRRGLPTGTGFPPSQHSVPRPQSRTGAGSSTLEIR